MRDIALRADARTLCTRRDAALADFEAVLGDLLPALDAFHAAGSKAGSNPTGFYGRFPELEKIPVAPDRDRLSREFRHRTDARVWQHLMVMSGLADLMDSTEREAFGQSLHDDPPTADFANVLATFERLWGDRDAIFARGAARVFSGLDPRFKSHDAFKVGSRIILTRLFDDRGSFDYHRQQQFRDIERILARLDGAPSDFTGLVAQIEADRQDGSYGPKASETRSRYFTLRAFKNGNAHLWFNEARHTEGLNKVLRGWYGEVLPDGVAREETDIVRDRTRSVSRDLAFYPTPGDLVDRILAETTDPGGAILEPGAGEGAFVVSLRNRFPDCPVTAIEIHSGRCARLHSLSRVKVIEGNFLAMPPQAVFSLVVMNPPFYRTHWMDHVSAARDWLRPGGQLVAILPVTTEIGGESRHKAFRAWAEKYKSGWRLFEALPESSFKSSGTRINTVLIRLAKPTP